MKSIILALAAAAAATTGAAQAVILGSFNVGSAQWPSSPESQGLSVGPDLFLPTGDFLNDRGNLDAPQSEEEALSRGEFVEFEFSPPEKFNLSELLMYADSFGETRRRYSLFAAAGGTNEFERIGEIAAPSHRRRVAFSLAGFDIGPSDTISFRLVTWLDGPGTTESQRDAFGQEGNGEVHGDLVLLLTGVQQQVQALPSSVVTTPLPAAIPLFLGGAALFGAVRRFGPKGRASVSHPAS